MRRFLKLSLRFSGSYRLHARRCRHPSCDFPRTDGIPAGLGHLRFQLSPSENEIGLLVEPLLTCDAVALFGLARRVVPIAQVFKRVVDL